MREYARISPKFWIGDTGRDIKEQGRDAQLMALYQLTSPHSNMIGMYWLPISYMANETGIPLQGAEKALRSLIEVGFCRYDNHTQIIWVCEMASFQIGDRLSPKDKQSKGVQNAYDDVPGNPFLVDFYSRYAEAFCMTHSRSYEGPSKILGSKEKEKAQEKATAKATAKAADSPIVVTIDLVGNNHHEVTQERVDFWSNLYPAVNVTQELRKMAGWCNSNKDRRKTPSGIEKFITAWLAKAQDQGGTSPQSIPSGGARVVAFPQSRADKQDAVVDGLLNVGEQHEPDHNPPVDFIDVDAVIRS